MEQQVSRLFANKLTLQEEGQGNVKGSEIDTNGSHLWNNPVILKSILGQCGSNDLRRLRLVNNIWARIGLESWRNKALLSIKTKNDGEKKPTFAFEDLCNLIGQTKDNEDPFQLLQFPFKRYRITGEIKLENSSVVEEFFWKKFGPHMEYLNVENATFSKDHYKEELQSLEKSFCPNLKEIVFKLTETQFRQMLAFMQFHKDAAEFPEAFAKLDSVTLVLETSTCYSNEGSHSAEFWHKGLKYFKNLKNVKINDDASLVQALTRPLDNGRFINLQKLSFSHGSFDSFWQTLRNYLEVASPNLISVKIANLYLCNVSIPTLTDPKPKETDWRNKEMFKCLKLCEASLKYLELDVDFDEYSTLHGRYFDLAGLNLPNLTHFCLRFRFVETSLNEHIPFDFHCLRFMPNLEVFRCGSAEGGIDSWIVGKNSQWTWDEMKYRPVHSGYLPAEETLRRGREKRELPLQLKHLKEFHFYGAFYFKGVQQLAEWMPNLEILETILDTRAFSKFFEGFKHLKKVVLFPSSRVNEVEMQAKSLEHNVQVTKWSGEYSLKNCRGFNF